MPRITSSSGLPPSGQVQQQQQQPVSDSLDPHTILQSPPPQYSPYAPVQLPAEHAPASQNLPEFVPSSPVPAQQPLMHHQTAMPQQQPQPIENFQSVMPPQQQAAQYQNVPLEQQPMVQEQHEAISQPYSIPYKQPASTEYSGHYAPVDNNSAGIGASAGAAGIAGDTIHHQEEVRHNGQHASGLAANGAGEAAVPLMTEEKGMVMPFQSDTNNNFWRRRQRRKLIILVVVILLIVVIAVGVGAGVGASRRNSHSSNNNNYSNTGGGDAGNTCVPPGGQQCDSSGDCLNLLSTCITACNGFGYCT